MTSVDRRFFLKRVGTAAAAGGIAAPALAQTSPEITWRLTTSWPTSLETLYGGALSFAKYVREATDNRFQIQCFPAGEIVPALQATDAVANGTVEACHTAAYYMWATDPTFAFGAAVPFGLNGRMQNAWWYAGGGEALMNAFYAKYNIYGLLAGNTGAQMGGWFRKEVNTPDDLKGMKMRIGGFGGAVITRVGMLAQQQMDGSEVFAALDKGTIDAAEWAGPYDDERLGFYKAAKLYYYPGWWAGGTMLQIHINKGKWEELPKAYQAICKAAAADTNARVFARYDAQNPLALKRLLANGIQLRPFSEPILDACFKAANDLNTEISAKNDDFKKLWEATKAFRADQYLWLRLADNTYDTYMLIQQRKKTI
jgi:TRAP-type mannitol/chloroaromatic compound transport system substrate-binding protein